MIGTVNRRMSGSQADGLHVGLPQIWVRALELMPGDFCEVVFDEILVVIPSRSKDSKQAERVLKAMREGR